MRKIILLLFLIMMISVIALPPPPPTPGGFGDTSAGEAAPDTLPSQPKNVALQESTPSSSIEVRMKELEDRVNSFFNWVYALLFIVIVLIAIIVYMYITRPNNQ